MDYYLTSSYYHYPVEESSYYYPQFQSQSQTPYYDSGSYTYGYYNYLPADSLLSYDSSPSSHCLVYQSIAAPPTPITVSEPDLDEYDTHPYRGGYDIAQTYGKPLPPTDLICYPPSSSSSSSSTPLPLLSSPVPTPTPATPESDDDEDEDDEEEPAMLAIAAPPIAGQGLQEFDEEPAILAIAAPTTTTAQELHDSSDYEIDEEEENTVEDEAIEVYGGGDQIQNYPPGYGLEAFDLCENLFGYWPCLSRPKNTSNCNACGRQLPPPRVDQWARTADYLFGNPDPYRGWEDDDGIRVSAYNLMHYQQPMLTMYQHHPGLAVYEHHQAHQYAQNSWFP